MNPIQGVETPEVGQGHEHWLKSLMNGGVESSYGGRDAISDVLPRRSSQPLVKRGRLDVPTHRPRLPDVRVSHGIRLGHTLVATIPKSNLN